MYAAIRRLQEKRANGEEGFTLIELLVVIIIIGILAAIAIPVFLNQRKKGWDSAATSDARNGAVVQETIYTGTGSYGVLADLQSEGWKTSAGTTGQLVTEGGDTYCVAVYSKSGNTFAVTSQGGVVGKVATGVGCS